MSKRIKIYNIVARSPDGNFDNNYKADDISDYTYMAVHQPLIYLAIISSNSEFIIFISIVVQV